MWRTNLSILSGILLLAACQPSTLPGADWIIMNAEVYTADAKQPWVSAVALRGDQVLAVGSDQSIIQYKTSSTRVIDARGNAVLPGLHDIHIHPFGLIPSSQCDLASEPLSLAEISKTVAQCIEDADLNEGEWLTVEQWNFTKGNTPDIDLPNMRAALDSASPDHPVFLRGNDGHHGAANSLALATATTSEGEQVGLSAASLDTYFGDYRAYIGTDAQGEPDGHLSESARYLLALEGNLLTGDGNSAQLASRMPEIAAILAKAGITSIQDAAADISLFPVYEAFSQSGNQTFRISAALIADFDLYESDEGIQRIPGQKIDLERLVADFITIRQRQQQPGLLKATGAKIFVDGVLEGKPLALPPGLPNAAVFSPYKQPRFLISDGKVRLAGYVDPESAACEQAQSLSSKAFLDQHGFYPQQCEQNRGVLEHDEAFIRLYIQRLEQAGFNVHAHAIGDRAVDLATEAFSESRRQLKHTRPQTITHIQQMHTKTLAKLQTNPLFLNFTFAWAVPDYNYDLTVTPFVDQLPDLDALYAPDNYAITNHYPARSALRAGAIITAGSDAPVDTRDPRPFVNLAAAITRFSEGKVYNAEEQLSLEQAIDAYTINGARALEQAQLTGSLEAGKKADLILLDRPLRLAASAKDSLHIANTQVEMTFFNGKPVYQQSSAISQTKYQHQ